MVDDLLRLDGQNAIIGGATGGIGKGIAKKFSEAGADLLLISRSEEKLKQLLVELNNSKHRYLVANYEDPYKLEEIVRNELESSGKKYSIMVNCFCSCITCSCDTTYTYISSREYCYRS